MTATTADRLECKSVATAAEQAIHLWIRRQVFVAEQHVFDDDDRDDHDLAPATVHVVGYVNGTPAGTVRCYPLRHAPDGGLLWQGDRLAVLPGYRRHRLGSPLVRYAVRTAGLLGGTQMIAHVQLANVAFFRHLGWAVTGEPEPYAGLPHQRMSITLGSPQEQGRPDGLR